MTNTAKKTEPVASLRIGNIEAAVWQNDGKNGSFYSTTITRSYRDGDSFKTAHSFDPGDLANVARLSNWAADRIIELYQGAAQ